MLRKQCGLIGGCIFAGNPALGVWSQATSVGGGGGGDGSPPPASVPGSAQDKADAVRGARGEVCPKHSSLSLQDSGL